MKISKEIQAKIRRIAKLTKEYGVLVGEVETYLENKGINVEELRDGRGDSLDELEYGNEDIAEALIKRIEEEY
jgi:hypothetical protein